MQVGEQDDGRVRKVCRRADEAAAAVQKEGLLPRADEIARGVPPEEGLLLPADGHGPAGTQDGQCKGGFAHFKLLSTDYVCLIKVLHFLLRTFGG